MKDPWEETSSMEKDIPEELSDRDRVTVTMKGGTGFDAPWIVLHAKDVPEANKLMEDVDVHGLAGQVVATSARFQSLFGPVKAPSSPSGGFSTGGGYRAAQAPVAAPAGAPKANCPQHGSELVYNKPFNSNGKEISGRMACPERGCRAITIWHNKDGSWKQQ
jgi:hypothetical protein